MKSNIIAAFTLLITIIPGTAFAKPLSKTRNTEPSVCYMQTVSGRIVNLNPMCGAVNNNNVTKATTAPIPTANKPTNIIKREIISTSTSANPGTEINKIGEQSNIRTFGSLNNGYNNSSSCINQVNTNNSSSQCGDNANQ